jgi:hypothetical protein
MGADDIALAQSIAQALPFPTSDFITSLFQSLLSSFLHNVVLTTPQIAMKLSTAAAALALAAGANA